MEEVTEVVKVKDRMLDDQQVQIQNIKHQLKQREEETHNTLDK